jgi:transcription elongation GreA/GreB family factor
LTQANETNDQDKSGILVPGLIRLGSTVKIENLSDKGRKLAFTIVKDGNDLKAGKLGMYTPLGQALIDAQEGDKVEYQVGVEIKEIRILKVS